MNRRRFVFSLAAMSALHPAAEEYIPVRKSSATNLFKAPEGHPNALAATPEGTMVRRSGLRYSVSSGLEIRRSNRKSPNGILKHQWGGFRRRLLMDGR